MLTSCHKARILGCSIIQRGSFWPSANLFAPSASSRKIGYHFTEEARDVSYSFRANMEVTALVPILVLQYSDASGIPPASFLACSRCWQPM